MKVTIYKDVNFSGYPLAINVNYKANNHLINALGNNQDNIINRILSFSPDLAYAIIKELDKQLEWYKNPLYQWAKKKTNIDKQIQFRR